MKKKLTTILLVAAFFAGLSLLLYPTVSDWWNSLHQTYAVAGYVESVADHSAEENQKLREEAEAYNQRLYQSGEGLHNLTEEEEKEYNSLLNITEDGIMGYVDIPKINVQLPIYHGTDASVLNVAVGHLEGSSLPVGGAGTHCVLSAHRGLPSARLFTDLDKLKLGDTFKITVLNRLITYEIDQILIVNPDAVDALAIEEGADFCTLLTCTPYGINTQRLLVRGRRIENAAEKPAIHVPADMVQIDPLVVTPAVAAPMLLALLVVLLVKYRNRR